MITCINRNVFITDLSCENEMKTPREKMRWVSEKSSFTPYVYYFCDVFVLVFAILRKISLGNLKEKRCCYCLRVSWMSFTSTCWFNHELDARVLAGIVMASHLNPGSQFPKIIITLVVAPEKKKKTLHDATVKFPVFWRDLLKEDSLPFSIAIVTPILVM